MFVCGGHPPLFAAESQYKLAQSWYFKLSVFAILQLCYIIVGIVSVSMLSREIYKEVTT